MSTGTVFRVTASRGSFVAASVTLTLMATMTYTEARCPNCNRLVLELPGTVRVETRCPPTKAAWSGLGPVAVCKRCGEYVEVITHP